MADRIHYVGPNSRVPTATPLCGAYVRDRAQHGTRDPAATTCKRCRASLRADGLLPREPDHVANLLAVLLGDGGHRQAEVGTIVHAGRDLLDLVHEVVRLRAQAAAPLTREQVRAYLARDPEAAAKVAGAWVRTETLSRRWEAGRDVVAGWVAPSSMPGMWTAYVEGHAATRHNTRAEAEAAVDALLAADGWVLGTTGEEVSRG